MNVLFTGLNGLIGVELSKIISKEIFLYRNVSFFSMVRSFNIYSETLPSYAISKNIILGDCNSPENFLNQ